jgi:hypothetical protein
MTLDDLGDRLFANAPEAAAILGRDPRTIRKAAEKGEIPGAHKLGAKWLFPVQWLREQAGQPSPAMSAEVDYDRLADLVTDRLFARIAAFFSKSGEAA